MYKIVCVCVCVCVCVGGFSFCIFFVFGYFRSYKFQCFNICYIILHDVSFPCVFPCLKQTRSIYKHTTLSPRSFVVSCADTQQCLFVVKWNDSKGVHHSLDRLWIVFVDMITFWCWGCNLPICFRIFQTFVPSPDSHPRSRKDSHSAPRKQWQFFSYMGIGRYRMNRIMTQLIYLKKYSNVLPNIPQHV